MNRRNPDAGEARWRFCICEELRSGAPLSAKDRERLARIVEGKSWRPSGRPRQLRTLAGIYLMNLDMLVNAHVDKGTDEPEAAAFRDLMALMEAETGHIVEAGTLKRYLRADARAVAPEECRFAREIDALADRHRAAGAVDPLGDALSSWTSDLGTVLTRRRKYERGKKALRRAEKN